MASNVQRNQTIEMTFEAAQSYSDPYNEIELDVRLTLPSGSAIVVPGFWAGGGTWKIRLSSGELGTCSFETVCSNANDAGLHGVEGTLQVDEYDGANPLYRLGRLRVAEDQRHFEHSDGTPFFWLGDTWWMGLTTRLDWPDGFQTLADDRVQKGFNLVQMVVGPYPDMDAWDERGRNEAGFPFEEGFARVNTAYYDCADRKILHLIERGLMPCLVGMWAYYLPQIGFEGVKRFWRYLIARYGSYPVVWCACGEGEMPWYLSKTPQEDSALQVDGWTRVMRYMRGIDGYKNLITIHPSHRGRRQVTNPAVMDFEMLQTGHSDLESVPNTLQTTACAVAELPRMPVVVAEVNYEGILGRAYQNVQRLCFYHAVLRGNAGHTYGANGIWQFNAPDKPYGPSPHGRSWGNTPWTEAMHLPGSRQIGIGGAFMRSLPWWELERRPSWIDPSRDGDDIYACLATGIPGRLRIVYVPSCWTPPTIINIERGVRYRASYFNTCTGEETDLGIVQPTADDTWDPPFPPEVRDWLIVLRAESI